MRTKTLILGGALIVASSASVAAAFPRNDSWHTPAWGPAATVRGEAGGIYGTGGQSDYGIRCSSCHTDLAVPMWCPTPPAQGRIDVDLTVTPAFGTRGAAQTYRAGQRYTITVRMTGEHRSPGPTQNLNGMAATFEDAGGAVVGRFVTDSGADSAACTPGLPPGIDGHGGVGTTFVYGDCHAVLSVGDGGRGRDTWTFDWVAPSGAGDLTFYVAAVDGDTGGESSTCDDVVERAFSLVEE